jgi:phage head maturation protease
VIDDEERQRIARVLDQAAPSLAQQLAIRGEAIRIARRALNLEGAERRRSLEQEREYLALAAAAERGEIVEWPSSTEYRAAVDTAPAPTATIGAAPLNQLYGMWVPYDQPTEILDPHDGQFIEVVRYGAAAHTIGQERRPPYYRDHGRHPVLGRTPIARIDYLGESAGGAWIEATPLDTQLVRDHVVEPARSGLLGHSFAFHIPSARAETWRRQPGGLPIREVHDMRVVEITACASPAYKTTYCNYRDDDDPRLHVPKPAPRLVSRAERESRARSRYLYLMKKGMK